MGRPFFTKLACALGALLLVHPVTAIAQSSTNQRRAAVTAQSYQTLLLARAVDDKCDNLAPLISSGALAGGEKQRQRLRETFGAASDLLSQTQADVEAYVAGRECTALLQQPGVLSAGEHARFWTDLIFVALDVSSRQSFGSEECNARFRDARSRFEAASGTIVEDIEADPARQGMIADAKALADEFAGMCAARAASPDNVQAQAAAELHPLWLMVDALGSLPESLGLYGDAT